MSKLTRREILKATAAVAGLPVAAHTHVPPQRTFINGVFCDLANIRKWDDSNGDTWDPFWADDGNLYAFNCDGRGFGKESRNLAFNILRGDSIPTLRGSIVNSMDEYGKSNKREDDNATWKACGQECIDGVFYAFVSRNAYGSDSGDYWLRQTAFNSSLIKSQDRGQTWTRSAQENYAKPMWRGSSFGAPFFIHYGRNGGDVAEDGADHYVYAVSTNGFWNDGDTYILGRVPRTKIAELNARDWSYFRGGNGQSDGAWSGNIEDAGPLIDQRTHCGQSAPCFISSLGLYLMVVWYNTASMTKWFEPNEMRYDFYQAAHPWGPWSIVDTLSDRFLAPGSHMYGPSLCAKFQRQVGENVQITMFTAGCPFEDKPDGIYKAWSIPLVLQAGARRNLIPVSSTEQRVKYHGNWQLTRDERLIGPAHISTSPDDSAQLTFNGTGIDYLADRKAGFGTVDVLIDNAVTATVDLASENFPRISGVVVFSSPKLAAGQHTIRIMNKSSKAIVLDSFHIHA